MMIGAVFTLPSRRGEHLGSCLLETVTCGLRDGEMDFAVLWTENSGFYSRLGWNAADAGVLGESESQFSILKYSGDIEDLPLRLPAIARVEQIRKHWLSTFVPREAEDYFRLPLPADASQILIVEMGNAQNAYALIGTFRDIGIIYEIIGHPSCYSVLWSEICRRHKKILVNDAIDSPSMQWFVSNTNIVFKTKPDIAIVVDLTRKTN